MGEIIQFRKVSVKVNADLLPQLSSGAVAWKYGEDNSITLLVGSSSQLVLATDINGICTVIFDAASNKAEIIFVSEAEAREANIDRKTDRAVNLSPVPSGLETRVFNVGYLEA